MTFEKKTMTEITENTVFGRYTAAAEPETARSTKNRRHLEVASLLGLKHLRY